MPVFKDLWPRVEIRVKLRVIIVERSRPSDKIRCSRVAPERCDPCELQPKLVAVRQP